MARFLRYNGSLLKPKDQLPWPWTATFQYHHFCVKSINGHKRYFHPWRQYQTLQFWKTPYAVKWGYSLPWETCVTIFWWKDFVCVFQGTYYWSTQCQCQSVRKSIRATQTNINLSFSLNKDQLNNYRPISLLSSLCKIYEKSNIQVVMQLYKSFFYMKESLDFDHASYYWIKHRCYRIIWGQRYYNGHISRLIHGV